MLCMLVTEEVFHELISPLKAVALENIPYILVTEEVFHELISPLKAVALENMELHPSH